MNTADMDNTARKRMERERLNRIIDRALLAVSGIALIVLAVSLAIRATI